MINVNAFLQVRGLECSRRGYSLFKKISFDLYRGQTLLIKGPNGIGKTTLLLSLMGLASMTGKIEWSEEVNSFGYIGHKNAIKANESVLHFIRFWSNYYSSNLNTDAILSDFKLTDYSDIPSGMLSEGEKKRLCFARLILSGSPVWLLDEPSSALDQFNKNFIIKLINQHNKNGGIVIAATHDTLELSSQLDLDLKFA